MRILYIDIDTLRPDHLGCYGYHRDTSTNIDRIAAQGARFENCYAPDAPCLPSRSALWSGRFGYHTGVRVGLSTHTATCLLTWSDYASLAGPLTLRDLKNSALRKFLYRHQRPFTYNAPAFPRGTAGTGCRPTGL